jgi:hypothetical protein
VLIAAMQECKVQAVKPECMLQLQIVLINATPKPRQTSFDHPFAGSALSISRDFPTTLTDGSRNDSKIHDLLKRFLQTENDAFSPQENGSTCFNGETPHSCAHKQP